MEFFGGELRCLFMVFLPYYIEYSCQVTRMYVAKTEWTLYQIGEVVTGVAVLLRNYRPELYLVWKPLQKIKTSPQNRTRRPRGGVNELYSFFNLRARWWVGGQRRAPAALPPGKTGTHCIGGRMDPRASLDGCGKSRPPTGIRSPGRPARSESLYRLSYRGPQ